MQELWNKIVDKTDDVIEKNDPRGQKMKTLYKERFWNPLKKCLLLCVILVCALCIVYAVYEKLTAPKSGSRLLYGAVLAVERDESGQIVLSVPYGDGSLRVHIDRQTRVYNLYPKKERIDADEIKVGDVVTGELRKGSEGMHDVIAKEICIETKTGSTVK